MSAPAVAPPPAHRDRRDSGVRPVSATIIRAIVAKDAVAFRRNRFLMLITFLVLIACGHWSISSCPQTVDETFSVGWSSSRTLCRRVSH